MCRVLLSHPKITDLASVKVGPKNFGEATDIAEGDAGPGK